MMESFTPCFTLRCVTFFFMVITSSRVALSVITLECDSLQQLCPDDDQQRMCVCNSTGPTLVWGTSISDQFSFGATLMAGANASITTTFGDVFSIVLTERANGLSSSTLMFNPSAIRAATGPVTVSCDDSASSVVVVNTTSLAVTSADAPSARQLSILSTICDLDNTSYQLTLQWNDGDTGGPDVSILYYLVEVTSSPPTGFVCPPEQCNVTTMSNTTITGLSCFTEYNFTVRAVNCIGTSDVSDVYNITTPTPMITPIIGEPPCFDREINMTRYTLSEYTGCYTVTAINISSNCTNMNRTITGMMAGEEIMLPSTSQFCMLTEVAISNCGNSDPNNRIASSMCPAMTSTSIPSPTMAAVSPSSPMSTSDNPRPTTPIGPTKDSLTGIAGGAGGAVAAIVAVLLVMATIFVCMFCPCRCCMPCRRKCCGCCPEEKICYRWGSDDEYCEPTPHVEKQPVLKNYSTETKEKDVETGQPSYPSSSGGPMYQDPNTIQRQAAPTGDLYAQPEKPARHQKQKPPPVEMATYQDPSTIQRQAAPTTGDLYAQPDKPPRPPAGPAPVYSEVNKSNPSGLVYADLSHAESPANVRRPQQVADTVYSEVRESRN